MSELNPSDPSDNLPPLRETVKRLLALPPDTIIVWKSHDESITQRSLLDQARHEKSSASRRRDTVGGDDGPKNP